MARSVALDLPPHRAGQRAQIANEHEQEVEHERRRDPEGVREHPSKRSAVEPSSGVEPARPLYQRGRRPSDKGVSGRGRSRTGKRYVQSNAASSSTRPQWTRPESHRHDLPAEETSDLSHEPVDRPGLEPGSPACDAGIFPLDDQPSACPEGIEPSFAMLESALRPSLGHRWSAALGFGSRQVPEGTRTSFDAP